MDTRQMAKAVVKALFPELQALKMWKMGDVTFSIIYNNICGHYCGYCRLPSRPTIETGYRGILTYVPVHGGITYANEDATDCTMVYGFDCGHFDDEKNPLLRDLDWLSAECERMAEWISEAARFEERYLLARTNEEKAKVLDGYYKKIGQAIPRDNFGINLNLLGGSL